MAANSPAYYSYRTSHGPITIRTTNAGVTDIAFGDIKMTGVRHPSELSNRAATELMEYFAGKRQAFDLRLAPEGSAFQQAVWRELSHIPYAQTRTNADLAQALGRPSSYRAVGTAVRKNPLAIIVPDHRIVGANGKPPGTGQLAQLHAALLRFEYENIGL